MDGSVGLWKGRWVGSTKLRGGRIWAEVDVLDDVPHGLGAPDGDDGEVESGIVEVVEPRLSWRTRTTGEAFSSLNQSLLR